MPEPANALISKDAAEVPLVTLFVMAYRQESTVREAIQGAFAQTYSPLEIILSDDASPDATFAVMQEMAAAYDGPHRVRLNRNPDNLGIIPHIDRIMELAQGEFVVQAGGDDISLPHRVERLASVWLASGRRAKLVHSAALRIDRAGLPTGEHRPARPARQGDSPLTFIREQRYVIGATEGWDREIFDLFGLLGDLAEIEDHPLPFRALLIGEVVFLEEPLIRYRAGGVSDTGARNSGWQELYGVQLRYIRWRATSYLSYLRDMIKVPPPDADLCRAICEERAELYGFQAETARASRAERLALIPRALALTVRRRESWPLKTLLKYLFDEIYMNYWNARYGRRDGRAPAKGEEAR